jgi:hypothetical protein
LPDYVVSENPDLVHVLAELKGPKVDVFFVYPEELRNSKRVAVFRDFLLARLRKCTDPHTSARRNGHDPGHGKLRPAYQGATIGRDPSHS